MLTALIPDSSKSIKNRMGLGSVPKGCGRYLTGNRSSLWRSLIRPLEDRSCIERTRRIAF